jgi:hypothetical protein
LRLLLLAVWTLLTRRTFCRYYACHICKDIYISTRIGTCLVQVRQ